MTQRAAILRALPDSTRDPTPARHGFAVTSGKGGTGKSTLAVNLAVGAAQAGARALLVDTDLGMADLNLLLGVAPQKSMLDALGGAPVDQILVKAHGIELLPALNGSHLLATLGAAGLRRILGLVESLATNFDTLILDVAAGIGASQITFAGAAADVVVVVNPEPLSIAGAYACLKALSTEQRVHHAFLVPNRVQSQHHADEVAARLCALAHRFLDIELTALPAIPADPAFAEAAQVGIPLLLHAPNAPASRAIRQLVKALGSVERQPATWWRTPRAKRASR